MYIPPQVQRLLLQPLSAPCLIYWYVVDLRLIQTEGGPCQVWSSQKYLSQSFDLSHQSDLSQNLDLSIFENSTPGLIIFAILQASVDRVDIRISAVDFVLTCIAF